MSKDLWFDAMEERLTELEDEGVEFNKAYEQASNEAERRMIDKLADAADQERQRRKDAR